MPTNFDLAPPPVTTGGITAVPIDVSAIQARLRFDGAAAAATGDATLSFVVGPTGGRPIFDLRQTITGVWLDGNPLPTTTVLTRDLGGGPGAQVRVLDVDLPGGSAHALRLTYALGVPQASIGGSYPPHLSWAAGPRLTFNAGFTDLQPGRYLEAWVPANLIWDQFALALDLEVTGTGVPHAVIANGSIASLGANRWSVTYPDRFTALSSLFEIRAADQLTSASRAIVLPSGAPLTIQAWKLAVSAADLQAALTSMAAWLADNEARIGPYIHGERFTAFLIQGGMEYDGACTSGLGALQHEAYHSWWGRGIRPASQADGWSDEGWNVYHDQGSAGAVPFDFAEPPTVLSSRNGYARVTPTSAYDRGARLFAGVAALGSPAALGDWMAEFYRTRQPRPTTTADLEAHLVARSGQPDVVDGFHRWVYGFDDPTSPPDLWLRDDPGHTGGELWSGRFWDSPDLWIRNADDGGTIHQAPIVGRDNWFHARVRNQGAGAARHFVVTFQTKHFAGVEFVWPADFLPALTAAAGFELAPGQETVVKARWPAALVPPARTKVCWLAAVLTRGDRPPAGRHVWEHGNLAQKNLVVAQAAAGQLLTIPFVLLGRRAGELRRLRLIRPEGLDRLEAAILPRLAPRPIPREEALADCGLAADATADEPGFDGARGVRFPAGQSAEISVPVARGSTVVGLALRAPKSPRAVRGVFDLVHLDDDGRVIGGLAVELRHPRRSHAVPSRALRARSPSPGNRLQQGKREHARQDSNQRSLAPERGLVG